MDAVVVEDEAVDVELPAPQLRRGQREHPLQAAVEEGAVVDEALVEARQFRRK